MPHIKGSISHIASMVVLIVWWSSHPNSDQGGVQTQLGIKAHSSEVGRVSKAD